MIYVLIPAHKPRLPDLLGAMEAVDGPEIHFVVVTNTPHYIEESDLEAYVPRMSILICDDEINLAKWYNTGVDWIQSHNVQGTDAILYIESDVRISYQAAQELYREMWDNRVSQIGPNFWKLPRGHQDLGTRNTLAYVYPPFRVCQASMVPVDSAHRMDERFAWWMEADDLEWKCKMDSGSRLSHVRAEHPGTLFHDMPPELTAQTQISQQLFKEKWGKTPWDL